MLCHSVLSTQFATSFFRSAVARVNDATVIPPAVARISGSLPTLPRRNTLLTPFAMLIYSDLKSLGYQMGDCGGDDPAGVPAAAVAEELHDGQEEGEEAGR